MEELHRSRSFTLFPVGERHLMVGPGRIGFDAKRPLDFLPRLDIGTRPPQCIREIQVQFRVIRSRLQQEAVLHRRRSIFVLRKQSHRQAAARLVQLGMEINQRPENSGGLFEISGIKRVNALQVIGLSQ